MILDVSVNDATINIVGQDFDAGIRLHESIPLNMVAVPVSPDLRGIAAGSPACPEGRDRPPVPDDPRRGPCIYCRFACSRTTPPWSFSHPDHRETQVAVEGPLLSDDMDLIIDTALDGVGLAFVVESQVRDHLEAGRLIQIPRRWRQPFQGFALYYPPGRYVSASLRAVVDHFRTTPCERPASQSDRRTGQRDFARGPSGALW